MRKEVAKVVVGSLALLLVSATPAQAQYFGDEDRYGPEISVGGVTALGTERLYKVLPGDTLWDLSALFFEDPWRWPTLWALNPQVTNPHWIYPGDVLVIQPPTRVEEEDAVVWMASRYNEEPRDLMLPVRNVGFIGTQDYQESGVIRYAREEKHHLGALDEIYIEFSTARTIRPEEDFTIYRVERELEHPETGEVVGKVVRFLGTVRVLDATKSLVKGLITKSYEEIGRGDLITEIFQHRRMLRPEENTIEQDAIVLATFRDRMLTGEHQYVFINKGTRNKVRTGNRFVALERGDPLIEKRPGLEYADETEMDDFPWENIGEVIVVEPYEDHSLGIITRSIHEIDPGAKLRMFDRY